MKKIITPLFLIVISFYCCDSGEVVTSEPSMEQVEVLPLREVKDISFYIEQINTDSVWLSIIKSKALEANITIEEMINKDAQFLVDQDAQIVKIENDIIKNPEWLDLVKKKSQEQEVPLDDVIRSDANFMYEESKKATTQH